jgi:hypothetical protein
MGYEEIGEDSLGREDEVRYGSNNEDDFFFD